MFACTVTELNVAASPNLQCGGAYAVVIEGPASFGHSVQRCHDCVKVTLPVAWLRPQPIDCAFESIFLLFGKF